MGSAVDFFVLDGFPHATRSKNQMKNVLLRQFKNAID
ncbi:hypothetical protein ZORO111902_13985 [Zobellia roscoffensis]